MADDGFAEILPEGSAPAAPCMVTMSETATGHKRRLGVIFRLWLLEADIAQLLREGPRFSVAYNSAMRTIRVRVDPVGPYEAMKTPGAKSESVLFRVPLPATLEFSTGKAAATVDIAVHQKALLIEIPESFKNAAPPAPKAPDPPHRSGIAVTTSAPGLRRASLIPGEEGSGRGPLEPRRRA